MRNVYTKFLIDISKLVEKSLENSEVHLLGLGLGHIFVIDSLVETSW